MAGVYHYTQLLLVEMENLADILPGLAFNLHPPNLHLLSSKDYRLKPLCLA
jgi:hypothetical protein